MAIKVTRHGATRELRFIPASQRQFQLTQAEFLAFPRAHAQNAMVRIGLAARILQEALVIIIAQKTLE